MIRAHAKPPPSFVGDALVGVFAGVNVATRKIKVGVKVEVLAGVWVGKGVRVEVSVGGISAAVCVAAAAAVSAASKLITPGTVVGSCGGDANVDISQLIKRSAEVRNICKARFDCNFIRFSPRSFFLGDFTVHETYGPQLMRSQ